MSKSYKCPFKPGDVVEYNGRKYTIIGLAGTGEKVVWGVRLGAEMEGTNRRALSTKHCIKI